MKTIRRAIAAVAAAAALSACAPAGPGTGETAAPPTPNAAPSATPAPVDPGERAAVETVFRSYYQALLVRDYATACALNAPETNARLLEDVAAEGTPVATCEEALAAVYAIPGAAPVADAVGATAQVQDVAVAGDQATVSWSFEVQGRRQPVTTTLRRIDGQWRLLATT
jgi:hypothetical protein